MTFAAQKGTGDTQVAKPQGAASLDMAAPEPATALTRRHDQRVVSPTVKIAVVKKALFGAREIAFCDLLDLSRGGVSMASQWLDAKLGQKLDMELYHEDQTFHTRGVVSHMTTPDPDVVYGVTFIFAPPELDRLIEAFLLERTAGPNQPVSVSPAEKRLSGNRSTAPDAQIYVKRAGSSEPFVRCEVDNVSKGGLGFYCPSRIAAKAPFKVLVQISDSPTTGVITGTVHYMGHKLNQYYYGMEFELVSAELVHLLDRLDGSGQRALPT